MTKDIAFLTMGCAKNEADSAHMQQDLIRAGYNIVGLDEPSDCIVVNTCSFIQSATEESLEAIFEVAGFDSVKAGDTKLVVCGCLPSRYGEELDTELSEADRIVPCSKEDDIVQIMDGLFGRSSEKDRYEIAFTYSPSEYVKISDGCNRFCSFCTIPYIRGRYHSFEYEDIRVEVEAMVDAGTKEIVLIAQDSGIWGLDLKPRRSLAWLLGNLAESYPSIWFRVMYLQPAGLTDELLDVVASHSNICNYFDIPLQHCDPKILESMNRQGSRQEYEEMVKRIRERIPSAAIRTTLIAGYPGETEEQFDELCDFVSEAEFDYIGIFAYSPEDGTPAATMPDQVDDDVKRDRVTQLRDIADSVSSYIVSQRVGSELDVLVLGREDDGQLYGRAQCQAPDVDGVTYLTSGEVGQFKRVTIGDTLMYEMEVLGE